MNIHRWLNFHAAFLVLIGIMFLLYSPLVMAWLGLTQVVQDTPGYWAMVSFARLFGMALLAWGASLLSIGSLLARAEAGENALIPILWVVTGADFLGAFSAAIQAASVWGIPASWLISLGFGVLGIIGLVLLILRRRISAR